MLKPLVAATALFAICGSSLVYAQQRFGGPGDGGPRAEFRHHFSADDMAAFTDARIAALKAGLELTPDQAKNWPAFEQALRDMAQLRMQRMQARIAAEQQGQTAGSPFDRLESRADNMAKASAALKKVADAGAPLYQSLNDSQKGRFTMLARILRPHRHMMHARGEGGWREGRGDGQRFGGGQRFDGGQGFGPDGGRLGDNDRGPGRHYHQLMGNDDGDQDSRL
jgi:hypothetical protein